MELRLASETQEAYTAALGEGFDGFVRVTESLQKQVAKEFGYSEEDGLTILRCAPSLMSSPDQIEEINQLSLYRTYNRMIDGPLAVGDLAPCVNDIYDLAGHSIENGLESFWGKSPHENYRPLVMIAGSIT